MRYHLKRHKYKLVVGVPMAVLLASSLSIMRSPEEVCLVPEDTSYVEVGETVTLNVVADSDEPINVIGGIINTPPEFVEILTIDRTDSIVDLWSEEPTLGTDGQVRFSGGILREGGFVGNGIVLTINARMVAEGKATISFEEVSMLAHDGTGRPVSCGVNPMVLSIRPKEHPTPDVNSDNAVNLYDFGIVSMRLFMGYSRAYDLNLDGRITVADIGIILSNMGRGNGEQSSLALLAR